MLVAGGGPAAPAAGGVELGSNPAIPASYAFIGYTRSPFEFLGPAKAFFNASTCGAARQASFFAPVHVSTAGSNLQALVLKTMLSFNPSFASHALRTPFTISFLS